MSVKMKFGSKDIPFVYKGDKLVYPNPIKDGLLLWYDFKGMRNTDITKDVAKDLSGNGSDGTLTNFNFTEGSGYKDNTLVFDGVDDSLTIPELVLDETAMSVMQDGKIYSYEDDKVVTVKNYSNEEHVDLNGLEVGGKNLIQYSSELRNGYVNTQTGVFHSNALHYPTVYIQIQSESYYTMSSNKGISWGKFVFYDKDKNYISGVDFREYNETVTYKAPPTAHFLRAAVGHLTDIETWKIEKGNISTSWSPAPEDFQTTSLSPSSLSNLQLYNRLLRKDELLHNVESGGLKELVDGVVVQDGLVLHYDFSHESNTSEYKDKAFDYSGNGNHGVLNNFNFTEESGYTENGLKFDGVDDFIGGEAGSLLNLDNKNQSIEITFEITNPEHSSSSLALLKSGGVVGSINVFSGWGRVTVTDNIGINHIYTPNRESLIGKKTHLMLTKNNGLFTAHINGELVEMKDYDTELDEPLVLESLSRGSGTLAYDGILKSSRIYNRPLTPEEVAHNYAIEKEKFNIVEGEM